MYSHNIITFALVTEVSISTFIIYLHSRQQHLLKCCFFVLFFCLFLCCKYVSFIEVVNVLKKMF